MRPELPPGTEVTRVGRVAAVPADDWAALEGGECPLWSRAMFETMERHDIGVNGFAYVVVRRAGRVTGVVPAFWLDRFPLDEALGDGWRRAVARLRGRLPGFGCVSLLVCGHPLAHGRVLGTLDAAESAHVLAELRALAGERSLSWTIFKEFGSEALLERLPQVGRRPFFGAPALPDAVVELPSDVDAYLRALKPKARRNLRSKLKKFEREAELRVEATSDWRRLVPTVGALYEQVFESADARFDRLSPAFFAALCESELDSPLIACWEGDRLVGCLVCVVSGRHCVSFRIGLDYDVARRHSLWFVLQHECVRLAIERGCEELNLMQTTYPAKRELGARLHASTHFLAHRSPVLTVLLRGGMARMLRMSVEAALAK